MLIYIHRLKIVFIENLCGIIIQVAHKIIGIAAKQTCEKADRLVSFVAHIGRKPFVLFCIYIQNLAAVIIGFSIRICGGVHHREIFVNGSADPRKSIPIRHADELRGIRFLQAVSRTYQLSCEIFIEAAADEHCFFCTVQFSFLIC